MTVEDYQWQIKGLLLGPGTPYKIGSVKGLGRQVKSSDADRGNGDGSTTGPDYLQPRTVELAITVRAATPAACMTAVQALQSRWTARGTERIQGTTPLAWKHPGLPAQRLEGGRPRDFEPNLDTLSLGWVKLLARYYAPDPRVYADAQRVVDVTYGASAVTLPNLGDHPAPVWWDVYGAATNPGLIRSESARFDLITAIGAADFYRVRTDQRTVTRASDSGNLYQTLSGTFLEIPPGGALFRSVKTGGAGLRIRATYRDTWAG